MNITEIENIAFSQITEYKVALSNLNSDCYCLFFFNMPICGTHVDQGNSFHLLRKKYCLI